VERYTFQVYVMYHYIYLINFNDLYSPLFYICGPGSSFGIATELRAGRSGIKSRRGRDFPPVQTGLGAHPAYCEMGTGSFLGVKCGRGVLLTTHPLLVPRSWKGPLGPLGHTGPVTVTLYLFFLPNFNQNHMTNCGMIPTYDTARCYFHRKCVDWIFYVDKV